MRDKLSKKYPDVCYAQPDPSVNLVFFVAISKAQYHGTRTITDTTPVSGTVKDNDGNQATFEGKQNTTRTVPNDFEYPLFVLSIETREGPEKWKVVHNIAKRGICGTLYGIPIHCHPTRDVVESAMKWIHKGGLSDPLQGVLGSDSASQNNKDQ